jgi:hypothetical protein
VSALFVIVNYGTCIVNGLGQVMVYSDQAQAERERALMAINNGSRANGYEVREVHLVK